MQKRHCSKNEKKIIIYFLYCFSENQWLGQRPLIFKKTKTKQSCRNLAEMVPNSFKLSLMIWNILNYKLIFVSASHKMIEATNLLNKAIFKAMSLTIVSSVEFKNLLQLNIIINCSRKSRVVIEQLTIN